MQFVLSHTPNDPGLPSPGPTALHRDTHRTASVVQPLETIEHSMLYVVRLDCLGYAHVLWWDM